MQLKQPRKKQLSLDSVMKNHFYIKLESPKPSVKLYVPDDIKLDMRVEGVRSPLELDDYDFKVFRTEQQANSWLKKYLRILKSLNNKRICKSRDLPAMLYKRRYMVQTLMGEKMQTYRHYPKKWKPGQLFNLHDQVFFLTVKLTSLKRNSRKSYCYKFQLA